MGLLVLTSLAELAVDSTEMTLSSTIFFVVSGIPLLSEVSLVGLEL